MHPRTRSPGPLLELARAQAGVLSATQVLGLGLTRGQLRRLTDGWQRLAAGVYYTTPTFEAASFESRAWAGILIGGEGARLCGPTAAALDGLADPLRSGHPHAGSHRDPCRIVHVVVPGHSRRSPEGFSIRREQAGERLPPPTRQPPRTRIPDTVLDLCARGDTDEVITWLTRACQRRLTTPAELLRRAESRHRLRHRGLIIAVLRDVELGATSRLEFEALRRVFRPHGFVGVRFQVRTGSAGRIADAAIAEWGLLIELDGRLGHVEEGRWRDRIRDNAHAVRGLVTLRYGWWEVVNEPCAVAAQIARVLAALGAEEPMHPCRLCDRRLVTDAFVL